MSAFTINLPIILPDAQRTWIAIIGTTVNDTVLVMGDGATRTVDSSCALFKKRKIIISNFQIDLVIVKKKISRTERSIVRSVRDIDTLVGYYIISL